MPQSPFGRAGQGLSPHADFAATSPDDSLTSRWRTTLSPFPV